jgi:hypothetical protein
MDNKRKMAEFLGTVSEMTWDNFIRAELDLSYSTSQSIVFALIRACAMENLPAIKSAINRLDGKVETPVQVIMPKVFYLYPNATRKVESLEIPSATPVVKEEKEEVVVAETPTRGFRETIARMGDKPRETPKFIIESQANIEEHVRKGEPLVFPLTDVKSVVAAHILHMGQERDIDAMEEIFNNLDGKLVEKYKVVADDLYIVQFAPIAPAGAYLNGDGVWQSLATKTQEMWRSRLGSSVEATIIED